MLDVAIIGGGPAGLAAALVLGRSRKLVALYDGGPPRNATASFIGGFITQDRIAPMDFRRVAHDDLHAYPTIELHLNTLVTKIERAGGKFRVTAGGVEVEARRVLLTTGVLDEPLPLEGSRDLWGRCLFQCPYCHGWEVRDRQLAFLAPEADEALWVLLLRSWSRNVMLFTNGAFDLPPECRKQLTEAGIPVEERRIAALHRDGIKLDGIVVDGDVLISRDVLFFRPEQRQVPLVSALALAMDKKGRWLQVDDHFRTSIPGIYAAGDLCTHYHGALAAAAAGSQAAHAINHDLTVDLVGKGLL